MILETGLLRPREGGTAGVVFIKDRAGPGIWGAAAETREHASRRCVLQTGKNREARLNEAFPRTSDAVFGLFVLFKKNINVTSSCFNFFLFISLVLLFCCNYGGEGLDRSSCSRLGTVPSWHRVCVCDSLVAV